jgi:hypothetical protein
MFKKAPRTKHQAPEKHQAASTKPRATVWDLSFGASLVLGVWCLVLFGTLGSRSFLFRT